MFKVGVGVMRLEMGPGLSGSERMALPCQSGLTLRDSESCGWFGGGWGPAPAAAAASGQERVGPRRIAALGLVLKGGVWYLVAQDRQSIRTYKAANIERARVCAQGFTRPGGFNLAAHWARASSDYEAGVYHEQADVKLSPRGVDLLGLLGPFVVEAAARTSRKPDRKGWVRCTVPLESIDGGVRELMRLGNEVNVIGPPALRVRLAETAARFARDHSGLPGRPRAHV